MNELLIWLDKFWPYLVVASPGVFATLKMLSDARAAKATAKREDRRDEQQLIKIAQEAAGEVIEGLRLRLADVEAQLTALRKEHAEMMANKDARIQLLEGENRQLQMRVLGYEDILRRHGIEPPKQSQPYWEMDANGLHPAPQEQ